MSDPSVVENVFLAALEKGTPEERAAFLNEACKNDPDLRRRVERLLEAHPKAAVFLEGPAGQETATFVPTGELVGAVIAGRYKLLEQIGEGGMGTVWVAEQTQPVRRKVALKLIKPGMDSKMVLSRFEAERQALALMDHPNIAKVLDGGTTEGGRPFFVMEYVKGVPFNRYCDDARLSVAQRLALFVPVCQAVQHAHQKGIIHRDLKPSNILVCLYDGVPVPKVIDFGLAKAMHQPLTEHTLHTAHGVMMGTPLYMSPEQAEFNNLDVDTRTDIYALGVILYELLTGTTPLEKQRFKEAAWHEMLRLIKEEEPPRPSARLSGSAMLPSLAAQRQLEPVKLTRLLRGELDWIVMKCLEKERSRRYDTANGLARDVERYLADELVEARPASAGYRLRKFIRRNKVRVLGVGAVAALLFLVIGLVTYGLWWAERQSAERRHEQELIAARTNDTIKATLDQAKAALKSGRIAEAGTLLDQANRQIEEKTPGDLRDRYGQLEKDKKTVEELNDIFEERWLISRSDIRLDNTKAKRRYPDVFKHYGLALGEEPADKSVEKIRGSLIADTLASSMAEWFFVDPKYPGLLPVVELLDPEPSRAELRAAIASGDDGRINAIVKKLDGSRLALAYAIGLGTYAGFDDRLRIMKGAWTSHPDSFALALAICSHLPNNDEKQGIEKVGWGRTAVALRPKNALAHYYLACALSTFGHGETGEAVEELRRAIQIAPKFARAHGQLALMLKHSPNNEPEALAFAQKAIKLDKDNLYGNVIILMDLCSKNDFLEAAKVYRRIGGIKQDLWDQFLDLEIAYTQGVMSGAIDTILEGLIRSDRPFEAYRLYLEGGHGEAISADGHPDDISHYNPACAAAKAGTGQGLDAPSHAERPAIRKRALEWLTSSFEVWKEHAMAFPARGASALGLIGSPFGAGPLLAASVLASGSPEVSTDRARDREVVHARMNEWLSDANLAGVRDDQWLTKLPADEGEQWRKLWKEVRSLRDQTAPEKPAAKP